MSQILARLRKVLALARDERANPHLRQRAKEAAEKLARKHGIDLATVKLDDYDQFNIAEVTLKTRNFQFEVRVCSMLVGEVFDGLQIRGKTYSNGTARLDFLTPKPGTPDCAVKLFEFLLAHAQAKWKALLSHHREQREFLKERGRFIFLLDQRVHATKRPHRKSFLSGLYHGAGENIKRVRAERLRLENTADMETLARTLLQPPPPSNPFVPPPNPCALMVVNKPKVQLDTRRTKLVKRRKPEAEPKSQRESDSELDMASYRFGFAAGAKVKLPV